MKKAMFISIVTVLMITFAANYTNIEKNESVEIQTYPASDTGEIPMAKDNTPQVHFIEFEPLEVKANVQFLDFTDEAPMVITPDAK